MSDPKRKKKKKGLLEATLMTLVQKSLKATIDEAVSNFKKNVESVAKKDGSHDGNSSSGEKEKSGCGSVVEGGYALGAMGLAAAALVMVRKKKENE